MRRALVSLALFAAPAFANPPDGYLVVHHQGQYQVFLIHPATGIATQVAAYRHPHMTHSPVYFLSPNDRPALAAYRRTRQTLHLFQGTELTIRERVLAVGRYSSDSVIYAGPVGNAISTIGGNAQSDAIVAYAPADFDTLEFVARVGENRLVLSADGGARVAVVQLPSSPGGRVTVLGRVHDISAAIPSELSGAHGVTLDWDHSVATENGIWLTGTANSSRGGLGNFFLYYQFSSGRVLVSSGLVSRLRLLATTAHDHTFGVLNQMYVSLSPDSATPVILGTPNFFASQNLERLFLLEPAVGAGTIVGFDPLIDCVWSVVK